MVGLEDDSDLSSMCDLHNIIVDMNRGGNLGEVLVYYGNAIDLFSEFGYAGQLESAGTEDGGGDATVGGSPIASVAVLGS